MKMGKRVILLLSLLPLCLQSAPAAQEEHRPIRRPTPEHSIQFPGHDAFYAIIGLKNNSSPEGAVTTERTRIPTTYRPHVTYESSQITPASHELDDRPISGIVPAECSDNHIWENVSPYKQGKQRPSPVDTRLSIEALFRIANRIEALLLHKNVNLVFSPLGLTSSLGQLMLAARGISLVELENLLAPGKNSCHDGAANKFHYSFRSLVSQLWRRRGSESYELSARNALFYQNPGQTLNREFTRRLSEEYATEIFSTNFRNTPETSLRQINDWASEASRGKIQQLIHEVPSRSTSAIMSSVIYFKGSWENVFNKQFTGPGPFYLDGDRNGQVKTVDFMVAEFELPYAESTSLGCRILALPYTNNETALYLVMPLGPPKRRHPPSTTTSTTSTASPPTSEDIPLVGRIQDEQTQSYGGQNWYGKRIVPSYSTRRPQTFFYASDSIIYPGPQALMPTLLHKTFEQIRQRRQAEPCSDGSSSTTTTARSSIWWTSTTTTTDRPCEEQPTAPREESPLSPLNLHKLASRLGPSEFSQLVSSTRLRRVSIILPKLNLVTNVKLRDALASIGAPSLFGAESDLSGAVEGQSSSAGGERGGGESLGRKDNSNWWKVDEVWQQSHLEVDEDGTEAASGTAVGIVDYGGDSIVFKVNSPFLAVLRHEATGAPIFWASIVDPS